MDHITVKFADNNWVVRSSLLGVLYRTESEEKAHEFALDISRKISPSKLSIYTKDEKIGMEILNNEDLRRWNEIKATIQDQVGLGVKDEADSFKRLNRLSYAAAIAGSAVASISILQGFLNINFSYVITPIAVTTLTTSLAAAGVIVGLQRVKRESIQDKVRLEERIDVVVRRAEKPKDPEPAWEDARQQLKEYVTDNSRQVRSIFTFTVLVMIVGVGLIVFGAAMIFYDPQSLNAGTLAAIAGIITEVIAASLLVMYKSTVLQAQNLIGVIERINGVGMSVKIMDSLAASPLKEETRAHVAKMLLNFYGSPTPQIPITNAIPNALPVKKKDSE